MSNNKLDKFNSEKWELPENLRMTEEMRTVADQQQAEFAQRAASPFGSMSPAEFERSKAAISIAENNRLLTAIAEAENPADFADTVPFLKRLLADAYAVLGQYDKAAELETNPYRRDEYQQILEAIERDDAEGVCDCPEQMGDVPVSNLFVKQNIWSVKYGKEIPLVACRSCGELNALASVPREIAEMRDHRRAALALVEGKTPREAKEILLDANHTTELLLTK